MGVATTQEGQCDGRLRPVDGAGGRRRAERLRRSQGSLYVGEGEQIVPLVNREIERALGAGALVAYTQDWHPAQTPHFQSGGAPGPSTASSTPGAPSCTRSCESPARWSARGRGARTATRASPSAIPSPGSRPPRRWRAAAAPWRPQGGGGGGGGGWVGDRLLREGDGAGRGAAGVRHGRPGRAGAAGRSAAGRRRAGACGDACRRGARRAAGIADRGEDLRPGVGGWQTVSASRSGDDLPIQPKPCSQPSPPCDPQRQFQSLWALEFRSRRAHER
jgi:hypothetical protein